MAKPNQVTYKLPQLSIFMARTLNIYSGFKVCTPQFLITVPILHSRSELPCSLSVSED